MRADPVRSQIEQDIEDCMSILQELDSAGSEGSDLEARRSRLKQRLFDLCLALGRLHSTE